jgi:predicted Zn finger-like uncharacterized protein
MDIACPECAAAYEIDEATLGPAGRRVRCAACGTVWRAMPVAPPDAASADDRPPAEAGEPAALAAEPAPAEEPAAAQPAGSRWVDDAAGAKPLPVWRRAANLRIGALAAIALLVFVALHQREHVVRLLPQTARLYAATGLKVNLRGIEIRNVQSRVVSEGEDSVLVVDGELVNVAGRRVDVPRLHFALLGPEGRQVFVWSAQADRPALQPGETLPFRRRLAAPPAEAREVSVRFLTPSDITAGIK